MFQLSIESSNLKTEGEREKTDTKILIVHSWLFLWLSWTLILATQILVSTNHMQIWQV